MNKLRNYIETWIDGKTVKGIHITPYEIHLMIDIYNAIARKEKPEFISENAKNILNKCGIKTKTCGIGWKVD